jgi:hypothetical protein
MADEVRGWVLQLMRLISALQKDRCNPALLPLQLAVFLHQPIFSASRLAEGLMEAFGFAVRHLPCCRPRGSNEGKQLIVFG